MDCNNCINYFCNFFLFIFRCEYCNSKCLFSIWNTYNPNGFTYGQSPNSKLSYNQTLAADAFFVNNYAQSDADEDRASTFEYMTASKKALCYNSVDYPIWKKLCIMLELQSNTTIPPARRMHKTVMTRIFCWTFRQKSVYSCPVMSSQRTMSCCSDASVI